MGKIKIIFADSDEYYVRSLVNYFMIHYSQRFDIFSFSSREKLGEFLGSCTFMIDILLIGSLTTDNISLLYNVKKIIRLSESDAYACEDEWIYKFRHSELLVKDILNIHSSCCLNNGQLSRSRKTSIVSFISSVGGCGKSTIAVSMSMLAGRRGLKVFYLDLEDIPSTGAYLKGVCDRNLSDVIYYLKENSRALSLKLESACCFDPSSGLNYFLPPDSSAQMAEFALEDIIKLIDVLRSVSLYDMIFIDLACRISPKEHYLVGVSDTVVRVCMQGHSMVIKDDMFDRAYSNIEDSNCSDITSKTIYVLNRFKPGDSFAECDLAGYKAVIKETDKLRSFNGERILIETDASFTSSVGLLLDTVIKANRCMDAYNGGYHG